MFQYFVSPLSLSPSLPSPNTQVKVVSTSFNYINGDEIQTNQYSVTSYERDLAQGNMPTRDTQGHLTSHHTQAIPGVFVNYEISPMKVVHTETRQSFAHFVTR